MKPEGSSPLRVLHVYRTYFPDPPGGLQEAIRQICLGTRDFGVESRVFALSPQPQPREIALAEGVVARAKSWAAPASCDLGGLHAFRSYQTLSRWADVVNFHFPWPFGDLLRLTDAADKPAILTYHSDIVRQRWLGALYGPLMRRTLKSMSAVVATSPAYAKTSQALCEDVHASRIKVIPLGIADYGRPRQERDAILLGRLGLSGRPIIIALGVLRYYKGLHTLIEAAPALDADVVIAGSGPELDRLQALAAAHGARNVIFAGQVSDEEKAALLASCYAMVLPSHLRSEAFGMVLVEAAMFGKPMVCCEIGSGTSYVNLHGVTGLVVPPESPERLAAAILELLAEPQRAARMGRAARERYQALFSGPALGEAYSRLYREVAGR
ncbi:glycosyltransferase [Ralstonia sp. ASV6]|uniref:glycosyltransferase n=1 Tax=Ralstonia sp. ASV6 TaxID=2795124 RepID=UPI001E49D43F|nr:glycosyltransferase [Ralstonia sp. ASV6]